LADTIQFDRSLPAEPNAFWRNADEQSPLRPCQMSWTAGDRFAPGTWYVHVSAVSPGPPDAEDVIEWSPVTRFTVPPTPGIVPGKGVDYATLGMRTGAVMTYFAIRSGHISNVKLGRVVFAKYDPFFGRLL
jgi:hypothetical protein